MTPTEILKHEHKIVLLVLEGAAREAAAIYDTGMIDDEKLNRMVDFFQNFVDRCHHAKEEKHLFPRLQLRDSSKVSSPIEVMLSEHEEGRLRVNAISGAIDPACVGDPPAVAALHENLSAYVELLRAHIEKENNVLFPMADHILSADDQRELVAAFELIETEELGEGTHEKYHQLAHDLADH